MKLLRTAFEWIQVHRLWTLLALALIGCGIYFVRGQMQRAQAELTAPLQQGTITDSVYGIGTVMANRIYQLTPGVTTSLDALFVKEGDFVRAGDRLLKIDRELYRAPFAGTITSLPYRAGGNIFPNLPVLILIDLADRYILVSLEQQGALRVRRGQPVKLSFDTIRESNFDGRVESIYSSGPNFLARIEVADLPLKILPGMTADVAITILTHENVFLVPIAAVEEGKFVWLQQTLPKKIEIKTGIVDRSYVEASSTELHPGDRFLIRKQKAK